MQAQGADDGQTLGEVEAKLPPLEDIGAGQTQEVARARIIDVQRSAVEVAGPARLGAYFAALVD